jgi:hypothetical protein
MTTEQEIQKTLINLIRCEAIESPADDEYERGCNAGMRRAIAIIKQFKGDASTRKDEHCTEEGSQTELVKGVTSPAKCHGDDCIYLYPERGTEKCRGNCFIEKQSEISVNYEDLYYDKVRDGDLWQHPLMSALMAVLKRDGYTPMSKDTQICLVKAAIMATAPEPVSVSQSQIELMADTMARRKGLAYATKGKTQDERDKNRFKIEIKAALNAAGVKHDA